MSISREPAWIEGQASYSTQGQGEAEDVTQDVVVHGGTPAGIMTAVAARRHGRSVALVEPGAHVGGVVGGGLGYTDIGKREPVGGLADEFLKRVVPYYLE